MQAPVLILLVHVAATFFMVGIIWFVQIVHYPLFNKVGQAEFASYQLAHMQRTSTVVLLPMFLEAVTGGLLLLQRPAAVFWWQVMGGLVLLAAIWLSTLFLQVPRHDVLTRGQDPQAIVGLLATNWVRTALWTARGTLVLWMSLRAFNP
ncbi:MAG: hypothetical protein HC915_00785 [Anaerolineae bacterium]|nr:hypothetical protein [Anaerolineae bacterium]